MGRFIAIDGLDGSGKETQTLLLKNTLEEKGVKVRAISFPCYESDSSLFVRMYLSGQLGGHPEDTNSYAASCFFAADRYISYRTDWKKDYEDINTVLIANRYTSANAVHQLAKLPREQWNGFLSWLDDFEFGKLCIPRPDDVIYLEMTPDISLDLIKKRSDQTGRKQDIHETDPDFIEKSYSAALYASEMLGWKRIKCYENGKPLTREAIHSLVMSALGY